MESGRRARGLGSDNAANIESIITSGIYTASLGFTHCERLAWNNSMHSMSNLIRKSVNNVSNGRSRTKNNNFNNNNVKCAAATCLNEN